MKPRTTTGVKIGLTFLVLAVAVGSMIAVLRQSSPQPAPAPVADAEPERIAFEDTVAAMVKAGEIVRVEDLKTPPVESISNAAVTLRAAAAIVDDDASEAFDALTLPQHPTEDQWKIIDQNVYDLSPALTLVDDAQKQTEIDWEVQFNDPLFKTLLPDVGPQRELAKLLAASAMTAHQQEQDVVALHRIGQILRVAQAMDRMPFLVSHRAALNIAKSACEQIEWLAATLEIGAKTGQASREQVQQLVNDFLADEWVLQRHREAMICERLGVIDNARLLGGGRITWTQMTQLMTRNDPIPEPTRAQIYTDGRLYLPYFNAARDSLTQDSWPRYLNQINAFPLALTDVHEHPLYAIAPRKTFDDIAKDSYEAMSRLRITAALLALRAYAVDHDEQPPASLESLVPRYLPRLPMDPMLENAPFVCDPTSEMPVHGAQAEPL